MKDYTIQYKDTDTLEFKILDSKGNETGETLKFNLNDVESGSSLSALRE